jgi:hypothetical protein
MLVELVTGREPLGHGSADDLARAATDPGRRPTPRSLGANVPDAVERVLARALAVLPAERWQTGASFWNALRAAMAAASGVSRPKRTRAPATWPVAVGVAFVLTLAASAVSDVNAAAVATGAHVATPTAQR